MQVFSTGDNLLEMSNLFFFFLFVFFFLNKKTISKRRLLKKIPSMLSVNERCCLLSNTNCTYNIVSFSYLIFLQNIIDRNILLTVAMGMDKRTVCYQQPFLC